MRLLIRMDARADAAYDNTYHRNVAGRIWGALRDTRFDHLHDANQPKGFVYSNPFPHGDMEEGDERMLLIASPHDELLGHIAEDLTSDPEFNIGEMPFTVTDITPVSPDVGEPGTSGVMTTATGVFIQIPPRKFDEYGIESEHEQAEYWRPEHTMEPFLTQIHNNLDRKHDLIYDNTRLGPSDVDGDLFDSHELIDTYSIPMQLTEDRTHTFVLSKWYFGYTVRDDHHRRHLNLAQDVGIGERNSLGLGFLNILEDTVTPPGEEQTMEIGADSSPVGGD